MDALKLANRYVELSNMHDLESIFLMFRDDAVYHSTNVGEFKGINDIREMMSEFFARFADVYWQVASYEKLDERTVSFDFTRHFSENGDKKEKMGRETIFFDEVGFITKVSVEAKP